MAFFWRKENEIQLIFFFWSHWQEEHDQIRARKTDPKEALEWSDYKSMPFTQCVSSSLLTKDFLLDGLLLRLCQLSTFNFFSFTLALLQLFIKCLTSVYLTI